MPRRKAVDPDIPLDPDAPPLPADEAPKQPKASSTKLVPKSNIESLVSLLNGVVGMVSPADALSMPKETPTLTLEFDNEFDLIVSATDKQQRASPTFRKYLSRFCTAAGGANLLAAVALILYVRLNRRGIVPSFGPFQAQPAPEAAPVEPPATAIPAEPVIIRDPWRVPANGYTAATASEVE